VDRVHDEPANAVAGPFGGLSPREAAARSAVRRRENAEARRADDRLRTAVARQRMAGLPGRDELGGLAVAVVAKVAVAVLNDEVPIRRASDARALADVFSTIARAEMPMHVAEPETRNQLVAAVQELRDRVEHRRQQAST
jgi:hypothetical protein